MEIDLEQRGIESPLSVPLKKSSSEPAVKTQVYIDDSSLTMGAYDPLIPRKLMEGLCGCSTNYLVKYEQEGLIQPLKVKRGGLDVVVYKGSDVAKVLAKRGVIFKKKNEAEVIAIWSQKGGTGKSATAQQLGFACSLVGKTLIIDTDSQGDISNLLGGDKKHNELLTNENELDPSIMELMDWTLADGSDSGYRKLKFEDVVKHLSPSLDVIPADLDLGEVNYSLNRLGLSKRFFPDGSPKHPPEIYMVKDVIDQIKHLYDFIVFDTPPNIETLNVSVLLAANRILIPLELEAKCILTVKRNELFLKRLRDMHPGFKWDKILILPNKYTRQNIKMKAYSTLIDLYGNRSDFELSNVTLPLSVIIDRCSDAREPVFAMATKHGKEFKSIVPAAKEFTNYFWAVMYEILDVPGEPVVFPMSRPEGEP